MMALYRKTAHHMPSEFLEAAVGYAKMGLAVVPLKPRGKRPIFDNWPEVGTSDVATVTRWWQQNPQANVGILTGPKSKLFVLDVDPKNGGDESFEALAYKFGTPETWRQITGRHNGGFHLFFRYPNFRVGNAAGIWPGIDIRGEGGQVVAPPSIHPDTGQRYEWDGLEEIKWSELHDAPDWILDALQAKSTGHKPGEALAIADKVKKGVQHMTLVSLGGALRRMGLDETEIFPVLMQVNLKRCEEPGPEANIRQIAHSMMRYTPSDKELWNTAATIWRERAKIEHQNERRKAEILQDPLNASSMNGREVFNLPQCDPTMVIENTLCYGYTLLAGRPKGGKSWLALQIAIAVANGAPLRGAQTRHINPGRVEVLALEDTPRRTSNRMHRILQDQGSVLLENMDFSYNSKPMDRGGLESLDARLAERRPTLVIIDTLRAFVNGGPAGNDVVGQEYSCADKIHKLAEKHQTAILALHHTNKIGEVAGTYGTLAGPDAIWLFKRDPGQDDGTLEITGRDIEEQVLALRFCKDPEMFGWNVIGEGSEAVSRQDREEILNVLRVEGQQSINQLATKLRKTYGLLMKLIEQMISSGEVGKSYEGHKFYAMGIPPKSYGEKE